ncbi:MAG: PAS domain-containing protein [Spirochaetales bacterium]|nr:PAS domain-containing protein [Spirochaetales bacterium]
MLKTIEKISNFNIASHPPQDYPRIRLGNITAFLGASITLLYSLTYGLILHHLYTGFLLFLISGMYTLYYPLFRRRSFFTAVRYYLILYLFHIFLMTLFTSSLRTGIHLYLLLISPSVYLLLNKERSPYFPFFISLSSLVFMLSAQIIGDRLLLFTFSDRANSILLFTCYFFVFSVLFLITSFYRLELNRRDDNTKRYIDKLNLTLSVTGVSFWEWDVKNQHFILDETGIAFMDLDSGMICLDRDWWINRLKPDDVHKIFSDYRDVYLKESNTFSFDYRFKRGDNDWIWINSTGYVEERDDRGKAVRLMGIHRETTREREMGIQKENLIEELNAALENIKTLNGMLPICSSCKKIRDDRGYWAKLETYIQQHSRAVFSHSICPDCLRKHYPEEFNQLNRSAENRS